MLRLEAARNKIYPMSFNLTVVLSQLLNRGRQICRCHPVAAYNAVHMHIQYRHVYESSYLCWDLDFKRFAFINNNILYTLFTLAGKRSNIFYDRVIQAFVFSQQHMQPWKPEQHIRI